MSSVELSHAGSREVEAALAKYKKKLATTGSFGVVLMAREIAGASATATRIAAKTRANVKKKPGEKARPGIRYVKRVMSANEIVYVPIRAENSAQAKLHKISQISRRGLAKSAWFWMMSEIGGKGSISSPGSRVRKSRKAFDVVNRSKGLNPEIKLHNKLNYATDAFHTKGRATVDTIGSKAANRFIRRMENVRA